jgi:hypothetical protein
MNRKSESGMADGGPGARSGTAFAIALHNH